MRQSFLLSFLFPVSCLWLGMPIYQSLKTFCLRIDADALWPQRVKIHSHNVTEKPKKVLLCRAPPQVRVEVPVLESYQFIRCAREEGSDLG